MDVSKIKVVLILDESNVLLDMGFEVTLTLIPSQLLRMRRTGLFLAVSMSGVHTLCVWSGMQNLVVVNIAIGAVITSFQHPSDDNAGRGKVEDNDAKDHLCDLEHQ